MLRLLSVLVLTLGLLYPDAVVAQGTDAPSTGGASPAQHVVLVSIDGFRSDFYLGAKWPAPNLKQMAQEGAHARGVRGVFPSVTYPSHTTMLTGAFPATHGIYYNTPFEPEGQTGRWYWETDLIQTPTLWHAVRDAGKTSASFIWPASVDAPVEYNIPEVWSLEDGYGRIQPMRDHEAPEGFLDELEREVLGRMNERTFNGDYLNREDRIGEMAAYVLETYQPNFITLHLIATDHFQHEQGREGPMVHKALAASDRAIGKILEAADRAGILEQTTFIVTGDHGFVDIHSRLAPNTWLADAGLIEDAPDRGDWTAAFHTSGAAAFLHLRDPADEAAAAQVRSLLNDLPPRVKKLFRIVERPELDAIGADPNVPFALAPVPGVAMTSRAAGPSVQPAEGGTHGFFPDFEAIETGFIAWGAGIRPGAVLPTMGLEDIAPLVSHLLRLDFVAPDGVLYPGIVEATAQAQ